MGQSGMIQDRKPVVQSLRRQTNLFLPNGVAEVFLQVGHADFGGNGVKLTLC